MNIASPSLDSYLCYLNDIERINNLSQFEYLSEAVIVDKLVSYVKATEAKISTTLVKYKIKASEVKKDGRELAKKYNIKIKKMHTQKISVEKAGELIGDDIKAAVKKRIEAAKVAWKGLDISKKIIIGIIMMVLVLLVNSLIIHTLIAHFPYMTAVRLGASIVAPLVEEASKTIFIHLKMPYVGTGIVYGLEMLMYAIKAVAMGVSLPRIIIVRIAGLTMHFLTTFIQKKIIETSKPDDAIRSKANKVIIAYMTGVLIHSMYNVLVMTGPLSSYIENYLGGK